MPGFEGVGFPLLPKVNRGSTFALRRPHSRPLSRWAAISSKGMGLGVEASGAVDSQKKVDVRALKGWGLGFGSWDLGVRGWRRSAANRCSW